MYDLNNKQFTKISNLSLGGQKMAQLPLLLVRLILCCVLSIKVTIIV